MEIINLKAWEMKEKLFEKEISSKDIIEAHLARIDEVEKDINAFISIDREKALRDAEAIDKKINNKENLGLLAGIPIGVKDNIVTKDFKTTAASKMLENFQSPYDATVIEKINKNHGIIIGKNNMDEFAMGGSKKATEFGYVRNPLDTSKIAGSSSGGSAASVASNEVALSIGSDTGGSVRQPANYCGIVGIKPSYGFISRYGLISLSNTLDQIGVFGRDVKDAVLMLNTVSGYDERDTTTIKTNTILDLKDMQAIDSIKGMKIALPKEFFDMDMDPKVKEEINKSIDLFKDAGAIVQEVTLNHMEYVPEIYRIINYGDVSSNMSKFDGIRYGHRAEEYETLDELYINTRTEGFGDEVKKRILLGTYLLSGNRGKEYYAKALQIRTMIIEEFNKVFSKFDIILAPSSPNLPYGFEETRSKTENYNRSLLQLPANLAGLCALSIPTASKEGLPVGLQIIGDRFKEENIIKAALGFERIVR